MPMPASIPASGNQAPTRRSNRPVTQFACRLAEDFFLGKVSATRKTVFNTTVECEESKNDTTLSVMLYGHKILTVSMSLPDEDIIHVGISIGPEFSMDGYPTRTLIERMNGLLDAMGIHGVIPEGVRIFKNQEKGFFCFGKGEQWIPVGQHYARNIILAPDANELIIQSSDLDINWSIIKKKKTKDGGYVYEKQDRLASNI